MSIPKEIEGSPVVQYSTDPNFAICQYGEEENFYLYGCDSDWNTTSDTWHGSIEDAQKQAAVENAGVSPNWNDVN